MQSEQQKADGKSGQALLSAGVAAAEAAGGASHVAGSDRTAPSLALIVGSLFSLGIYIFLASLALSTVFFEANVIRSGNWVLAPILVGLAAIPVLGILVFEYAYSRALAGFRYIRGAAARRIQGGAGAFTVLVVTLVHPVAGMACIVCVFSGVALLYALARLKRNERLWDFVPSEAASMLAGRDRIGLQLAGAKVDEHALARPVALAFSSLALVTGYGAGSYLTTIQVIDPSAVTAIALLNALASHSILASVRDALRVPNVQSTSMRVEAIDAPELEEETQIGVRVRGLSVMCDDGRALMSDLSFTLPPGTLLGVDGETGAGKSLLLNVLSDPFSLQGMQVRGRAEVNGVDLWRRAGGESALPAVHVSEDPMLLPTSGQNNLSCFHDGQVLEQAKRNLERLVFSNELVNEICDAPDATRLPGMQRKAIALARALTLSPSLYLLDRPEDALPEKQIGALLSRLKDELRLGRSAVIVTQNRALIEACDQIMELQGGRIVDFGTAEDIRSRKAAGWARFGSERTLETEENLEIWIRSHFKRDGDEPNRRKVAQVASEMLAFSCQTSAGYVSNRALVFELKLFKGYCMLRMLDDDRPISAAALQKAENDAAAPREGHRLNPLASIIKNAIEIEAGVDLERRVLTAKIEIFDPRLTKAKQINEATRS